MYVGRASKALETLTRYLHNAAVARTEHAVVPPLLLRGDVAAGKTTTLHAAAAAAGTTLVPIELDSVAEYRQWLRAASVERRATVAYALDDADALGDGVTATHLLELGRRVPLVIVSSHWVASAALRALRYAPARDIVQITVYPPSETTAVAALVAAFPTLTRAVVFAMVRSCNGDMRQARLQLELERALDAEGVAIVSRTTTTLDAANVFDVVRALLTNDAYACVDRLPPLRAALALDARAATRVADAWRDAVACAACVNAQVACATCRVDRAHLDAVGDVVALYAELDRTSFGVAARDVETLGVATLVRRARRACRTPATSFSFATRPAASDDVVEARSHLGAALAYERSVGRPMPSRTLLNAAHRRAFARRTLDMRSYATLLPAAVAPKRAPTNDALPNVEAFEAAPVKRRKRAVGGKLAALLVDVPDIRTMFH